jgi:DNA mismatch repair protein MutL
MKRIQKLDDKLIAQIAAGEVIESPAAIVKELVENALDAGASEIDVQIDGDGFTEIQVRDNGGGIHADDLPLAVESFATSKISSLDELIAARTMGFRGEALGSIASVSRLRLESRQKNAAVGAAIQVDEHGKTVEASPIEAGTRVQVRDLFYNVPVRRDYYKNALKIRRQIADTLTQLTVAHPQIAFRYRLGEDDPVFLPVRQNLIDRLGDIWGEKIAGDLIPVYYQADGLTLEGYVSKFYFYRTHAGDMRLWVNQRPVAYKPLTMLLRNAYGELMPKGRFPFAALFLSVAQSDVDVNVHPQKREVRFRHEVAVQSFLRQAFTRVISAEGGISAGSMVRLGSPQVLRMAAPESIPNHLAGAIPTPRGGTDGPQPGLFSPAGATTDFNAAEEAPGLFPEHLSLHTRLFNTFIVATGPDGLYLIDQHTAHERINYERFQDLLAAKKDITQHLVSPVAVNTAIFNRSRIEGATAALRALGFEIEDLGQAGYALQSVPGYIEAGEETAAFETALSVIEGSDTAEAGDLFDQLAKDLSCRHAIRKGETASLTDFRELMEKLKLCRNPLRCPHGRPTVVRIDEKEVFAYFKRQV